MEIDYLGPRKQSRLCTDGSKEGASLAPSLSVQMISIFMQFSAPSLSVQMISIFMQFSAKHLQNNMLVHPLASWRPPGKSWIHHCCVLIPKCKQICEFFILGGLPCGNFFCSLFVKKYVISYSNDQWRIQDFPEGAPTPKVGVLTYLLPKTL